MAIITLNGIEKVYRTKDIETIALENVNLTVNPGEFVSVMWVPAAAANQPC